MTLAETGVIAMPRVLLPVMTHALSLSLLAALGFIATGTVAYSVASCPRRAARGLRASQRTDRTGAQRGLLGGACARPIAGRLGRRRLAYGCAAGLSALAVVLGRIERANAVHARPGLMDAAGAEDNHVHVAQDAYRRAVVASAP